jgi:hypothetical protein
MKADTNSLHRIQNQIFLLRGQKVMLRARFKNRDRGCVVLDQPLHDVKFLLIRLISRPAAGLRHSRGPFLKQALSHLAELYLCSS